MCMISLPLAGAFTAGWPFAHAIEQYGWTTAYQLLELCGIVMVTLCGYLLVMLVRGLSVSKKSG